MKEWPRRKTGEKAQNIIFETAVSNEKENESGSHVRAAHSQVDPRCIAMQEEPRREQVAGYKASKAKEIFTCFESIF